MLNIIVIATIIEFIILIFLSLSNFILLNSRIEVIKNLIILIINFENYLIYFFDRN